MEATVNENSKLLVNSQAFLSLTTTNLLVGQLEESDVVIIYELQRTIFALKRMELTAEIFQKLDQM